MKLFLIPLLVVCVLVVEAQNLTARTFEFAHGHPVHSHGAVHASHSLHFHVHGHHDHVVPSHNEHGSHAHQFQGHSHHDHGLPFHNGLGTNAQQVLSQHDHALPSHNSHSIHVQPIHGVHQGKERISPGQRHTNHGHGHHHQPSPSSGAVGSVAANSSMMPVVVSSVVNVTAAHTTPPTTSRPGHLPHINLLSNITTSLGTVVGKVVNPVVTLLKDASVWLNRTALTNHGHNRTAVSPVQIVYKKILAFKKHPPVPHPSSLTTTVETAIASHPAVTVTSPTATPAAATPSRHIITASAPVHVLISTVGAPAPALRATASRSHSATSLPASADTKVPQGRTGAVVTTVPLESTTAAFPLKINSPTPTSVTGVQTLPPTEAILVRSGTVFPTVHTSVAAFHPTIAPAVPFTQSMPQTVPPSGSPDVISTRSGTVFATATSTIARRATTTAATVPFTEPVSQSAHTSASTDLTASVIVVPTHAVSIRSGSLLTPITTVATTRAAAVSLTESFAESAPTSASIFTASPALLTTDIAAMWSDTLATAVKVKGAETSTLVSVPVPTPPTVPLGSLTSSPLAASTSTDGPDDRSVTAAPNVLTSTTPSPVFLQLTKQTPRPSNVATQQPPSGFQSRAVAL